MAGAENPNLLALTVETKGEVVLVHCSGRLVAGTTAILNAQIGKLLPGPKRIVLDLTHLTHVDSMGMGTLVRVYVTAKSHGCRLELINLAKQVRNLLSMANLLSVFAVIGESGITPM